LATGSTSSEEQIEKAKTDWAKDWFPKIEGETGRIPLPGM